MGRKIYPGTQIPEFEKSKEQALQVSLNYGELAESPLWTGSKHEASAGVTTFLDVEITHLIKLVSGLYVIKNFSDVHEDDYVEISMIDKNDVLGRFSQYGLTVGQDILQLNKFVRRNYCWEPKFAFESIYGAKFDLVPGLFVRFAYNSSGSIPIKLYIQLFGCIN